MEVDISVVQGGNEPVMNHQLQHINVGHHQAPLVQQQPMQIPQQSQIIASHSPVSPQLNGQFVPAEGIIQHQPQRLPIKLGGMVGVPPPNQHIQTHRQRQPTPQQPNTQHLQQNSQNIQGHQAVHQVTQQNPQINHQVNQQGQQVNQQSHQVNQKSHQANQQNHQGNQQSQHIQQHQSLPQHANAQHVPQNARPDSIMQHVSSPATPQQQSHKPSPQQQAPQIQHPSPGMAQQMFTTPSTAAHNAYTSQQTTPISHQPLYTQPATPQEDKPPHPINLAPIHQPGLNSPQVLILPQPLSAPQTTFITSPSSQLRPTINLEGMHYLNVNSNENKNTIQRPVGNITTTTLITPPENHDNGDKVNNSAQFQGPQIAGQPYSIIPTPTVQALQPNSNVVMIQQPLTGQYQLAQLYPLIQAVNPATNTITTALPAKTTPHNGAHMGNNNATCYTMPLQTVKREQTRCTKSPGVKTPLTCAIPIVTNNDKYIFRTSSDEFVNHSAVVQNTNNNEHLLEQFDPEVISMILNNTNIDNFNLDTHQWNPGLFDNPPPKSSHNTSSNPSPISAHSPGT